MDIITLITLVLTPIIAIIKYMVIPIADIIIAYKIIKRINEKKVPAKKAEEKEDPPT